MLHPTRVAVAALSLALLAGCVTTSGATSPGGATPGSSTQSKTLTVLTHDSFALSDDVIAGFKKSSGYDVTFVAPGDAGTLVNQLILTKDSPLGDVVFGIDNTFAGRAIKEGVVSPYASPALPASAAALAPDASHSLTPIDYGNVCLNADTRYFTAHDLALPATLDDLTKPEYADLLVVPNPASSSPGLAFLVATVGAKGDPGYLDYWTALKANGLKVVKGWTEAYTVEFSGSSGKGSRPLVLSYNTSPAYEVGKDGTSRTVTLTKTCFRQVEYAAIVKGAQNEEGAAKFIDFLLSDAVQAEIPEQMYMYPVSPTVKLPPVWTKYAATVSDPIPAPADLATKRDTWIKAWTAAVIG
ncbi:MAG: thiamine ABC transporter substrate-binding protein [Propionicimonas sp.]